MLVLASSVIIIKSGPPLRLKVDELTRGHPHSLREPWSAVFVVTAEKGPIP